MSQELVITVVNDCACVESGECLCEDDVCDCECECIECEIEYVACACGRFGECGCSHD